MDMKLSKLWEIVKDREAWHAEILESQRVRHYLVTKQATTIVNLQCCVSFRGMAK